MAITLEQLEQKHTDLCYKFTVYKNRYKRYLDQSWIDSNGKICMSDFSLKDAADEAYQVFLEAYENYQQYVKEFEETSQWPRI